MTGSARRHSPGIGPGEWALDRRVLDRRTGVNGCVHGRLRITAAAGGFDWYEEGTLTWAGHTAPVSRLLRLRPRDGQWWMLFADERPFHPWNPGAEVVHECGADTYRGRIDLRPGDPPRVQMRWDVTGPRKHQLLITRLRLLGRPSTRQPRAAG